MKIVFFGHSAWGLEVGRTKVLIDPYAVSAEARERIETFARDAELVLVSHGAFDHLGLAFDLLRTNERLTLVTEPAVYRNALQGFGPERLEIMAWNGVKERYGVSVRAVEVRHVSAFEASDGSYLTGMPLGFLIAGVDEPNTRLLHLGDTSIFSDLALFGQLYKPTIALIGVGAAKGLFAEMTPAEGAQAALWLGVDVALPMHYEEDAAAGHAFCAAVAHLPRTVLTWMPEPFTEVEVAATLMVRGAPS
jgi:L-ascorbate metabolism protein UlaG (beta-lactamase superfamily)